MDYSQLHQEEGLHAQYLYDALLTFGSNLEGLMLNYNYLLRQPALTEEQELNFKSFAVQLLTTIKHVEETPLTATYPPLQKCLTVLQVFSDYIKENKAFEEDIMIKMNSIFYQALVEWTNEFN